MTTDTPTLPAVLRVERRNGVTGQVSYTATVQYPAEPTSHATFVGNVYGGPVVMVTEQYQTFVTNPERFGTFGPSWVRRFFGQAS